ncbi:hypothetical protein ABD83_06415 [Bacillus xiamenensis]|nr:hypothetical protein [Bacillus xiamenensis]
MSQKGDDIARKPYEPDDQTMPDVVEWMGLRNIDFQTGSIKLEGGFTGEADGTCKGGKNA